MKGKAKIKKTSEVKKELNRLNDIIKQPDSVADILTKRKTESKNQLNEIGFTISTFHRMCYRIFYR